LYIEAGDNNIYSTWIDTDFDKNDINYCINSIKFDRVDIDFV